MLKPGSVALVTGAARGLGAAIAIQLAKSGARVACVDRLPCDDTTRVIDSLNCVSKSFSCDITDAQLIADLVTKIETEFGGSPTNILVNCAGITRDNLLWKTTEMDWDDVLLTNLKAPYMLTQAVTKRMLKYQKERDVFLHGSVVNISSIVGKVGNMGQTNYAAAKAGLIGFTKAAAKDLAKSQIRVNCILPGFITTPMSLAVPEKILEKFRQEIPLGRMGEPEDIAEAVLFLSSMRSKYITGATLEVTGGLYM